MYSYDVGKVRVEEIGPNDTPVPFLALDKSSVDDDINAAVNEGSKTILIPFNWVEEGVNIQLEVPKFRILPDYTIPNPKEFIYDTIQKVVESIYAYDNNYSNAMNAVKNAYLNGAVVVGKTLDYNGSARGFPASLAKDRIALAVGSTIASGFSPSQYSSTATTYASSPTYSDIDIVAPGVDVMTTTNNGQPDYEYVTGTATAAATATGIVSLMQSKDQNLEPDDIKEILRRTAEDIGTTGYDVATGFGLVDAGEALDYIDKRSFTRGVVSNGSSTKLDDDIGITLFNGIWGPWASGTYYGDRYEVEFIVDIPKMAKIDVWFRAKGTKGISLRNPNHQERFAEVVEVHNLAGYAKLKTYVYYLESNVTGQINTWLPNGPDNAEIAYTIASEPYTQNTENIFVQNASINSNKTFSTDVGVDENVVLTITGDVTFNGNADLYLNTSSDLVVGNNGVLNLQPGTTVFLDKDAEIKVNSGGKINADGVTFKNYEGTTLPADRWKHIKLLGDYNTFTNCTIEGADKGIYVASSGNTIEGGSIRNNGIGIYLSSGNATLKGAIVDGPGDGAVVRGTATLYTEHNSQTPGWGTRIRNNDRGIDISDFGRAVVYHTLIQQNDYGVYISGDGDLENDGSISGQGYGSYQPDAQTNYDIFNISSHYASAHFNFWGSSTDPPSGSRFYGSVGYQNPLSCDPTVTQQHCDPIDEGGGGDPCDPMFPCENSTIQTTTPELVAGSSAAGSTVSNDPSFDLTQKIKEIIQNVYSHIEEHPNDPEIYRYVERIHDLLAVYDKDNSIRSWANFDQKLNSWSNLYKLSQDFSGGMELEGATPGSTSPLLDHLPVLKKLGQTTMLITLNDLLHQADYEQALLLANRYESYMDSPANQAAILAAKVVAWEQTKQYGKALAAYEQIENIDLNIKGDPDFKAPDYSAVKEELADSMGVRNQVKSMPISENQAKQREITETPKEFGVGAPYPNPFNPTTTIPFTLPVQSAVKIEIYNMLGRKVATLADRVYEAGQHQVQINGDHLSSGIYFIRSTIGGNSYLNKITLVK